MSVFERAERASFEIYILSLVKYIIIVIHNIFNKYNQNLWGPLFVGALGSCPLCPLLNPALVVGDTWGHLKALGI